MPSALANLVNQTDFKYMMVLKRMYIAKIPALSTWTANNDCSNWIRVQCDLDRVSGIYFMKDGLGGPFPTTILKLSYLRKFYADGNAFTGVIPESISVLQRLQVLRLNGNKLHGRLPASIGKISGLYKFYVRGNGGLVGTIPSSWSKINLQEAYFEGNKFSGPVPTVICNWGYLEVLRMGSNKWHGSIPACFSKLVALREMYFDQIGTQFNGPFPTFIGALTSLELMFLNGNGMHGHIPESIGKCTKLNTLFFSGNYIQGPLPKAIGKLVNLQSWVMEFNRVDGQIPSEIGQATSLQRILFDNNLLTGPIPASIGNLQQLTILLLEGNGLSGTIPPQIPFGCKSLVQFNVESNQLTGPLPIWWSSTSLLQINIRSNFFTGAMNYKTRAGKAICPPLVISSWVHSSSAFNCLTQNSTTCGPKYWEPQRPAAECVNFCRANGPRGPCDGNGVCNFVFPKNKPRRAMCTCNKGYKLTKDGLGCK